MARKRQLGPARGLPSAPGGVARPARLPPYGYRVGLSAIREYAFGANAVHGKADWTLSADEVRPLRPERYSAPRHPWRRPSGGAGYGAA